MPFLASILQGPRRRRVPRRGERGQTLVEFALAFPVFWVVLLGIIEFAFAFNAVLSVNYASRNAALVAAEVGNGLGADCVILLQIEQDVTAPASANRIQRVNIYRTDRNGTMQGTATVYLRNGGSPTNCTNPNGTPYTLPYTKTADGYPEAGRCNVLAGCPAYGSIPARSQVDTVGVKVEYDHAWVTPLHNFIGGGSNFSVDRANAMRMEPVL
ncbi:MAG TPA: TadE/TadG family type IV pilus assembly protein [Candidatus Limnocylindrales bacterium]